MGWGVTGRASFTVRLPSGHGRGGLRPFLFQQGCLTEEFLAYAEHLARSGRNRPSVRALYALRGERHLKRREWALAVESLHEAIRMTRETGASVGQGGPG